MGFFTGILTAGLYVMVGNSLGNAMRPMKCERAVPVEQNYVKRYDLACTKQQTRVTATQAKIDKANAGIADSTTTAKAKKRLENDVKRFTRLVNNYQKLANRDCGNLEKAESRLATVIDKCTAKTS